MNLARRLAFVATVRSYVGTPYHDQGRLRGVGMDCPGPLIVAARAHRYVDPLFDVTGYVGQPDGKSIRGYCDRFMQRIGPDEFTVADVLLCAFRNDPERHLGIVTDATPGRMYWVEAEGYRFKEVRETRLVLTSWAMRLTQAYRIPGIDA